MIKAVLFDFGGVMAVQKREDIWKYFEKVFDIGPVVLESFFQEYGHQMQRGELLVRDYSKLIEKKFHVNGVEKEWEKFYRNERNVNRDMVGFVKKLKEKYAVGLISNANDLRVRLDREKGLYHLFDPIIISCEVGFMKPERGIFDIALKRLGNKAGECVFIDDREKLLDTPKSMGFHVIHFRNVEQLKKDLEKLGVR